MGRLHTLLLVDLKLDINVDGGNDQIAGRVERTDTVKDIGVFEGYALRHLHHPKDDDDVDAVACVLATGEEDENSSSRANVHLGAKSGHFDKQGGDVWFADCKCCIWCLVRGIRQIPRYEEIEEVLS